MLAYSVPLNEKRVFIRWFLKNYQLKRREGVWILNYLLSNEALLEHVHFVDEAHYCPRAIVMSTVDTTSIPFRFYKDNIMTSDAEKAFHDLRINSTDEIYFQLNFPSIPPNPLYLAVLEENPYAPDIFIHEKDRVAAQQLLENSVLEFQEHMLLKQIDEALDTGDKERFFELSNLLQALKHSK